MGNRSGQAFGFRTNERNAIFYKVNDLVYQLWLKYLPPRDLYTLDEISMILENGVIVEPLFYLDGLLLTKITPKKRIRQLMSKYGGDVATNATVDNLMILCRRLKIGIFVSINFIECF